MSENRPAVPIAIKRALMEESGYRCAIPTCRTPEPLEMAHIDPWSKVVEHRFDNMIVLCRNDHYRFDHGDIAIQSVKAYKANLAVLNGRYSEIERRLLEKFVDDGMDGVITVDSSDLVTLSFRNLVRDGLVTVSSADFGIQMLVGTPDNPLRSEFDDDGRPRFIQGTGRAQGGFEEYRLTREGADFIQRWFGAELLSPSSADDDA